MCLTCPKHMAKGQKLGLHRPVTAGGRNVSLHSMTGNPGRVACSICGGAHSSQTHAGDPAKRHMPGFQKLTKGYPGSITGHVRGTGKKLKLGR